MLRASDKIKTKVMSKPEPEPKKVSHENGVRTCPIFDKDVIKVSFTLI
jgi:hypothetical protein